MSNTDRIHESTSLTEIGLVVESWDDIEKKLERMNAVASGVAIRGEPRNAASVREGQTARTVIPKGRASKQARRR